MAVIIYQTNAGSSEQYANMLSEKLSFPAYPLSKADRIDKDEEVIFIGWLMAGTIQGLPEVRAKFEKLKCVCFVGLKANEKTVAEVKEKNSVTEPLFFLPGNFHIENLKGMYRMMMSMMMKMIRSKIKEKPEEEQDKILSAYENGIDQVSEDKLGEVIAFLN